MSFARAPTTNIDMADQEKGQNYEASGGDLITVPVKNGPFAREKQIQVEYQDSIDPEKIKGAIPIVPAIGRGKDEESDKCGRLSGEPGADFRVPRQRMHSVPFAIPPGLPVAWTSLTLPSGKVISTFSVGDGESHTQEGYTFGPTASLASQKQPGDSKATES